jgi:iron complex outermembrane receptor protein
MTRTTTSILVAVVAASSGAWAEVLADIPQRERIEVIGSHIRRVEGETGLPVQAITREEMERGGIQTAQDLIERVSANQSYGAWNDAKGVGDPRAGFTSASLRGLGSQRTLVLLNGRRLAPYALTGGQSVDLSGIPVSAIERVEVLKDGASAIYGTDAIGGVINFILRKDYRGAEANASYFSTDAGGGDSWRASAVAGWGDLATDGFNAFISADRFRQDPLAASAREFSRTAYLPWLGYDATSTNSWPANIYQVPGFGRPRNPTIPSSGATAGSCLPPYSFPTARFPLRCAFDYAAVIETIPRSDKTNVVGKLTWQLNADHLFFAEGSYYRGTFLYKISPTPVASDFTFTPMTLPPSSPFYPTAYVASLPGGNTSLPVGLLYRTVELGPRTSDPVSEQGRAILGLQGTVRGWDYQATGGYTANRQKDRYRSGLISEALFGPLLRSGVVNPFGANTPDVLERMRATQIVGDVSDNRASHYGAEFKASGTPFEMKAGALATAFGLEARRESLEQVNSAFLYTGDVIGGNGVQPSLEETRRTVWSAFAEASVPVTRTFEANLALRYDHYSDFGNTTNPKLTLRWQPSGEAMLRGSYGSGFRAPTLSDLFLPNTFSFDSFKDPLRCPVTELPSDCEFTRTKAGGNQGVQPETSRQLNLGIVFEPTRGFSASVDYYRVKIADLITVVPLDAIQRDFERWAPSHVVRKPSQPEFPGLPGPIDYVDQTLVNAGTLNTSGVDLDARYRIDAEGGGRITIGMNGTYVIDYKSTDFAAASPGRNDPLGNGAISRWRHYASIDWSRGPWGATLAQNFQLGYSEADPLTCDPGTGLCSGMRRVGSYSVIDVQGRYTGHRNLKLSLGVRNLLDRAPPLATGGIHFQTGYEPSYGDPRGRIFYATARWVFR